MENQTPPVVKVRSLHPSARLPEYATKGAAGADLRGISVKIGDLQDYAWDQITIPAGQSTIMGTGLCFEIPEDWVMKIHSRSGLGFKFDTQLANGTGIIDSDYRGEVMIKLINLSDQSLNLRRGERIAQALLEPAFRAEYSLSEVLTETERGEGGFGSTGTN